MTECLICGREVKDEECCFFKRDINRALCLTHMTQLEGYILGYHEGENYRRGISDIQKAIDSFIRKFKPKAEKEGEIENE